MNSKLNLFLLILTASFCVKCSAQEETMIVKDAPDIPPCQCTIDGLVGGYAQRFCRIKTHLEAQRILLQLKKKMGHHCSSEFVASSEKELDAEEGLLLKGPPGVGKTSLVKAIAKASGNNVVICHGQQLVKKHYGEGAEAFDKKVDEALSLADETGKVSVLFIDEVDCVARDFGDSSCYSEHQGTTNHIFNRRDELSGDPRIFFMFATNAKNLHPAFESRFCQSEYILEQPDSMKRAAILDSLYSRYKIRMSTSLQSTIVKKTNGASVRFLENFVLSLKMQVREQGASQLSEKNVLKKLDDQLVAAQVKQNHYWWNPLGLTPKGAFNGLKEALWVTNQCASVINQGDQAAQKSYGWYKHWRYGSSSENQGQDAQVPEVPADGPQKGA